MPKSKHAPALFELIGNRGEKKTADKLALPKWLKTGPQPEQRTSTEPPQPASQPMPYGTASTPMAQPGGRRRKRVDVHRRWFPETRHRQAVEHNRCGRAARESPLGPAGISLNPTNAILIGGGIVIALFCFYLAGRGFAHRHDAPVQVAGNGSTTVDDVKAALGQPANGQILEPSRSATTLMAPRLAARTESDDTSAKPQTEKAVTPAAVTPADAAPSVGPNRIVVESFKVEHQKSAEHVRKWLLDNYGLKTELKPVGDRIWLVTAEGFDLDKPGRKWRSLARPGWPMAASPKPRRVWARRHPATTRPARRAPSFLRAPG